MRFTKRQWLILGAVAGVALVAILLIVFLPRRGEKAPPAPTAGSGASSLPEATESVSKTDDIKTDTRAGITLRKISENPVFDFWVSYDGRDVYYLGNDGRVFSGKNGPDLEVSAEKLSGLNRVESSPSSTKILAAFGDPRRPQWGVFGASDRFWSPLPGSVVEAAWGKNDNQIFVFETDNTIREIDLAKSPFGEKTVFQGINLKDFRLSYSPKGTLFLAEKPSSLYESRVFQIDLSAKSINLVLAAQKGLWFQVLEGRRQVMIFSSPFRFLLLDEDLAPIAPDSDVESFVSPTFPGKCGSEGNRVLCFVPRSLDPVQNKLPDDYLFGRLFTADDLFEINLSDENANEVLSIEKNPLGAVDAKNVKVRGDKIYFINRYDNALYELTLTKN